MKCEIVAIVLMLAFFCQARADENENRAGVIFNEETALVDGVRQFNDRVKEAHVGDGQLPLTAEEVIAAIRGWIPKHHPAPVMATVFATKRFVPGR